MNTKYQNIKNILKSNTNENSENIQKSNEEIQKLVKDLNLRERDIKRFFTLEEKEKEFYMCETINGYNDEDFRKDILGNLILNPKYGTLDMTSNENALKIVSSGEHIVSHSFGGLTIEENLVILTRKINEVKLAIPLYELGKQEREELSKDYGINPEDFLKDFNCGIIKDKYNLILEKDCNGDIKYINVGVVRISSQEDTASSSSTLIEETLIEETLIEETLQEDTTSSSTQEHIVLSSNTCMERNYSRLGLGCLMMVGSMMCPKFVILSKLLSSAGFGLVAFELFYTK